MFPESIPELEALYRASFDAAEKALKRFERIDSKTLLSTINQLRYAARHYLDSTVATSDADRREKLIQAISHCRRAEYDAVDSSVVMVGKAIVRFSDRYQLQTILAVMPDFSKYYAEAQKSMAILRNAGSAQEIVRATDERATALESLLKFWTDIQAKQLLVKQYEEQRLSEKQHAFRMWLIGIVISLLALCVSIVTGLLH